MAEEWCEVGPDGGGRKRSGHDGGSGVGSGRRRKQEEEARREGGDTEEEFKDGGWSWGIKIGDDGIGETFCGEIERIPFSDTL